MYVYFDTQGVIKEVINDTALRKGSSGANKIYCYFENTEVPKDLWIMFELPDGTKTNQESFVDNLEENSYISYDKNRDMKYFKDYTLYNFYTYTLTTEQLSQSGLVLCAIRRIGQDNEIQAQGLLTFNVEKSVIKDDSYITQAQYDYLLMRISNFTAFIYTPKVSEDGIISWTNNAGYENPEPVDIMGNGFSTASATITKLNPEESPTIDVEVSGEDRKNKRLHFDFAIPQGVKGDKGDIGKSVLTIQSGIPISEFGLVGDVCLVMSNGNIYQKDDATTWTYVGNMKGETGNTATIDVGTTETLEPEDSAYVKNVGDNHNGIFNFGIPKGKKGDKGDIGNGISYAKATAVSLSSSEEATAEVSISGDDKQNQILNFKFGIPNGEDSIGGIFKFEVINGVLYMHYATEQKPDVYLITKDNYETLGVDKSLIGNLVFIY